MMRYLIRSALLPFLLCGCLRTEPAARVEVIGGNGRLNPGAFSTNVSGFAISCSVNTNAFTGGDRLVLSCAVTNTSASPVTIDTPDLHDAWMITFDTKNWVSSGPFPPCLPTPRTNTLLRGEGLLVVKEYTIPEGITLQAWREAVLAAQENRAEHHSRFVPKAMTEDEFAAFATKALPTNMPPCFSFQTMLCLPIVTSTTSYTIVDVTLSNIPIKMEQGAEPVVRDYRLKDRATQDPMDRKNKE